MIPNNYKTSLRVPSQLPEFIRDDLNYETFVAFVEAYYEWMELANTANANTTIATTSGQGVTYGSKNLQNYSDVDNTLDGFLKYYINEFLQYFPQDALADKAKVLKIARQLYQSKGTPASYKLLFRLLYNTDAELLMTGELVFRASAGNWYVPKFLKITGDATLWLTPGVKSYRVFGRISKATATIENVLKNGSKCDVFISSMNRLFRSGEDVIVVDNNNQDVYVKDNEIVAKGTVGSSTVTGKIVGSVTKINLDSKFRGLTYNIGDPVVVYGGLFSNSSNAATAFVSDITKGSIQRINTLSGGYGYIPGNSVINFATVSNTVIDFIPDNGGAEARVATFDTSPGANSSINRVILDIIANTDTANASSIRIDANNYYFLASNTAANANCTLANAFSFLTIQGYPISSVAILKGGSGFSKLPIAVATANYFDTANTAHNVEDFGILAPIQIINGGTGYQANDKIIITGGSGNGAAANVATVDGNGKITSVRYVNLTGTDDVWPLGGMGYRIADIEGSAFAPAIDANTITTVSGANAVLRVPGILGAGASFELQTDRIGSVTKVSISDPGEEYVSTPSVSLRVQDLCVTGVTEIGEINAGDLIYQGEEVLGAPYQSYIYNLTLLENNTTAQNRIYNLRVYNYYGTPKLFDSLDPANTIIKVSAVAPYPTMNLISTKDISLGYVNGVKMYGDGTAKATAEIVQGFTFGQGQYLDTKGHPSSFSILQSQNYNDFTYVLSVEQPISKYRDILKNLLHPAGTKVIGRDLLKNEKAFGVSHYAGSSLIKPLQYWANWPVGNPDVYVTMKVPGIVANSMIKVIDGGTGYSPNTTISIISNDGVGSGATATVNVVSGVIKSIDVTNQGTGYIVNPTLLIVDANTHGIKSVTANSGSYGSNGYVTFVGGVGTANANAYMYVKSSGEVQNVTIINSGNYSTTPSARPPSGNASLTVTGSGNTVATLSISIAQASNVLNILEMNGGNLASIAANDKFITVYPEQTGGNSVIYSISKSYDSANAIIVLEEDTFLTFVNVFYGYANTDLNKIQISDFSITNTPGYNIVNAGAYSNSRNHIEDIVFVGDNIVIAGNTYVVQDIDYDAHLITILNRQGILATEDGNTIITETGANNIYLGEFVISAGTKANPIPMTINRTISTGNVFIKTLI